MTIDTAHNLYDACLFSDRRLLEEATREAYGFTKCPHEDEDELLEMYQDLIFNHFCWKHRDDLYETIHRMPVDETYSTQDPYSRHYEFYQRHPELWRSSS